jgi:hypothetical protein
MRKLYSYRGKEWRFLCTCGTLLLLCAALLPALAVLSAPPPKKTEKRTGYGTGVRTGFKIVKYHDTCIMFQTYFISGDFFLGLKEFDTPTGKQFKKKKESYRTFPEIIIVDVEADALPCDNEPHLPPFDIALGLLGSLSFRANWTSNVSNADLGAVAPIKVEYPGHGNRWDYFLEIRAKDIPLTAALVVDMKSRNHIHVATLSTHL